MNAFGTILTVIAVLIPLFMSVGGYGSIDTDAELVVLGVNISLFVVGMVALVCSIFTED